MHFTTSREALQGALNAVLPAVTMKSSVVVVTHCLVEATARGLRLTANDFDHVISAELPADVEEPGAVTLPARKLAEIIAKAPASPIEMKVSGTRASIKCGASRFTLVGLNASEFPATPKILFESGWLVRAGELRGFIKQVAFAASTLDSRPVLSAVRWEFKPDHMRMVATDATCLAMMDHRSEGNRPESSFNAPAWALKHVAQLFDGDNDVITVAGDKGHHIGFRSASRSLVTRLVEGPYPQYEMVIPKDQDCIALVDRAVLMGAVERVKVTASGEYDRMQLSFDATGIDLSSETDKLGDAKERCPAQYSGAPVVIGLDAVRLLEVLRHMPGSEVRIKLKGGNYSVVFEPTERNDNGSYMCLLMQLRAPGR